MRVRKYVDLEVACDLCGSMGSVEVDVVSGIVRSAVHEQFKPAQDWNAPWEDIESGLETPVYDLRELLDGEFDLLTAVDPQLYGAIEASFGDDTMWVTCFETDMRGRVKDSLGWEEFRHLVQHRSRYLQLDEQSSVARLYGVPSPREMLGRVAGLLDRHQMYRTLPIDELVWRGRLDDTRQPQWGGTELSSPPGVAARQSRMSAAGIPMFYGAFDIDTVAAELPADEGRWLMVGAFRPARPLLVIDLTTLPPSPGPFAENAAQRDDELDFLREFCKEVSRPVLNPELVHIEYAPTQAVTEYLRYLFVPRKRKRPVDGIVYASSRGAGTCAALFATHDQCQGTGSEDELLRWAPGTLTIREPSPSS